MTRKCYTENFVVVNNKRLESLSDLECPLTNVVCISGFSTANLQDRGDLITLETNLDKMSQKSALPMTLEWVYPYSTVPERSCYFRARRNPHDRFCFSRFLGALSIRCSPQRRGDCQPT